MSKDAPNPELPSRDTPPPEVDVADHALTKVTDAQVQQLVSVERVTLNVSQRVIVTTEDKLRLSLQNHMKEIEGKKDWIAPLSVFLALILALVTADFRDFIVSKDTWRAIFIIASILSFGWMCIALRKAFAKRTIEGLIDEIKADDR